MNINELLFSPPFCLDIFKVIYNKNEYLFVGRLSKEELIAINKIKENKNITNEERSKINLRYGQTGVDILKHKLTSKTILIEEVILLNDNIKTIKEKIFLTLSTKYGNDYLDTDKQYLYTKKILDYDFITSIIPNLYNSDTEYMHKKHIVLELTKIMDVSVFKLNKDKYTMAELQDYFTKLVNIKTYIYHDIGLSQYFVNKRNNKIICDYIDLNLNKDTDNDFNERVQNNDYTIFNNIINQIKYDEDNNIKLNQDIYLFYLDDIKTTLHNYKYITKRYFSFVSKNKISDTTKNRNIDSLEDLYLKHSLTYRKILDNLGQMGKQLNIINYVKVVKKNIITLDIDLINLYEILQSSTNIPFINISYTKIIRQKMKKIVLYKLHKPLFNSRSIITNKMLTNWKNGILDMDTKEYDNSEEMLFRESNFIHMVVKYEHNYMTFYIQKNGNILAIFPILKNRKEKISDHFFNYMSKINETITYINNLINNIEESNTPESKVHDINKSIVLIDETNIKNIKMNFSKFIPLGNIPNLNHIFKEMKLFFYSNGKNKYGFKNINNYGTEEYIINYIIDRFFENNQITLQQIAPEIIDNFNISESDIRPIFNKIFDSDDRKEKMIKKKRNNEIEKAEIYFDNILGKQKTIINFTCHNINQLVFVNNLINLIIIELTNFNKRKVDKGNNKGNNIKPSLKKSLLSIPKSSNSVNNNYSSNGSNFSLMNNNSNNSLELEDNDEDNEESVINIDKPFVPEKIDELDYKNKTVSKYFKHMREKYDPDFFKGSNFTRGCPAVEDRIPVIISKNLWKYITENKRLSDGLDKRTRDEDIDDDKYRIITGSEDNENVYICPRIYCVRCMVPIKTDEFIKKGNMCPYCSGKPTKIKGVRGVFDNEHTIKIRSDSYWKNNKWEKIEVQCEECLVKIKYIDYYNNDYKCTNCNSENINVKEDELIPFLHDIKNAKLKIPKILENSLNPMYPRTKQGSIYPCCDKSSMEKKNKETKEDYFKDTSTKLSHDELGLLPNDLIELLNNQSSFKVKEGDFVKTKTNKKKIYYKYLFFENVKMLAFDKKKNLTNRKLLFRLGTNNINENNSFILALHKLKCIREHDIDRNKKDRTPFNMNDILDNIDPLVYASVNNGNLHETFQTNIEVDTTSKEYNIWFSNITKIKNLDKESSEVKKLYASFMNFRDYSNDKKLFKDYTYYIELLSKSDILLDKNYNIVIIEKVLGEENNISVQCPLFSYNEKKETIFILKFIDEKNKEYFEPLVKINFELEEQPLQFSFTEKDPNLSNIFKILKDICQNNLDSIPYNLYNITKLISNDNIMFHVINKQFKVIGVILNNNLFIPTYPSGLNLNIPAIKSKHFNIITYTDMLAKNLLLSYQEFKNEKEKLLKTLNNTIYPNFLTENRISYTKTNGKKHINGIITKDNLFIPLLDKEDFLGNGNQLNREHQINNLIYNTSDTNLNNRSKQMNNYYKTQKNYEDNKILVNRTLLKKENINTNRNIRRIMNNPVLEKVHKKKLLLNELLKLDLVNEFSNKLVNELLINKKNGLEFLTKKLRAKKTKKISRNNIGFGINDFNNIRNELYSKKKYKYERDITQFNTKKIKNKELGEKYKLNTPRNISNTPISIAKSIKIKPDKKIPVPEVNSSTVDMFGYDRSGEPNVKPGKCVLPFKTRYNSYTDKEQTQTKQNTEYFYDCLPTNDGPICPTGNLEKDEVFKRNIHQYGYCNYNDYFDRQEANIKKENTKKFNEEECQTEPMLIRRKTKGGITDNVKITKKCIINQDRKKTAFNKKNPSETFKCLKKTKKGLKLYTDKDSADCFV
jgi:hypothetical protein